MDDTLVDILGEALSAIVDEFGDGMQLKIPPQEPDGGSSRVIVMGSPSSGWTLTRV